MRKKRNLDNIPIGTCKCSVCGLEKDNTEFPYYQNQFYNKGPNHPWTGKRRRVNTNCITCTAIKAKQRAEIRLMQKDINQPAYGELCECCQKPVYPSKESVPRGVNGTWVWQLDHDHESGEFRGWLCKQCNTGLGNLGDDLDSLLRAVQYLGKQDDLEIYTVWSGGNIKIKSKVNQEYLKRDK